MLMAEGDHNTGLSHSMLMGSEDGDLSQSVVIGSQEVYDYYCQPCDVDHYQVEAMCYCSNCEEYLCKKCSTSHKKFKQMSDHDILDIQKMTHKPPVSKKSSRAVAISTSSGLGNSGHSTFINPASASTRAITMATHVMDIKLKGSIYSSALMSTNQLLVADWENSKVVLVDNGRQVSELKLISGTPWQVTRMSNTEAAVSIPNNKNIVLLRIHKQKIGLLKTQPQLSVVREISVQGDCYGIAYMDNTLFVTFWEGHVEILDMTSKVLHAISADKTGRKIFHRPDYITVDSETGSLYVSDWDLKRMMGRLVKLSKEGIIEAIYSSVRGGWPRQVVLDTQGMVYVAWGGGFGHPGSVDHLNTNCVLVRTIISDLSSAPSALTYDEATQQLYVGQVNGVVKVYRLS